MAEHLALPFIVGETYEDRSGKYKVISVQGKSMTIERSGGKTENGDAETRAGIYRNILADRNPKTT
jgi:hypothetical protein